MSSGRSRGRPGMSPGPAPCSWGCSMAQSIPGRRRRVLWGNAASAREQLSEGRRRLAQVELERAEAVLLAAERRCQGLFVLPGTVALYGEVLRWRGVALFELHRTAEATQVFRRAQALLGVAQLTEA